MNRTGFFKAIGGAIAATFGVKYVPKQWACEPPMVCDLKFIKKPVVSFLCYTKDGYLCWKAFDYDSEHEFNERSAERIVPDGGKFVSLETTFENYENELLMRCEGLTER